MKSVVPLCALAWVGLVLGTASPADAQIRDNDSSVATLAIHCAVSSGYSPQGYEDYCRRLAKTLSLLSGTQQTRVFGYLPMASGSLGGGTPSDAPSSPATLPSEPGTTGNRPTGDTGTTDPEESASDTPGNVPNEDGAAGNPTPAQGSEAKGDSGTTGNSDPGFLVNLVKELNNFIDGTVDTAAPIVGGTVGIDEDGATVPADPLSQKAADDQGSGSKSSGHSSSPWGALLGWLREAEEAYKNGNLGSFLGNGRD